MLKRLVALLSALAVAATLGVSLASSGAPAKAVRIGVSYDPTTFDPAELNLDSAMDAAYLIYEPLLRDVGGVVGPGAAEAWETSEDKTQWTFHLRKADYSDGTPITAQDFRYSILRTIDPAAGHGNSATLLYLVNADEYYKGNAAAEDVKAEALDDYTLKLSYVHPVFESEFTNYLYTPVKKELAESLGIEYGTAADKLLCNGAFVLKDWASDSSFTLVRNAAYWDAASVALDEVTFVIGAAASDTAVDVMLAGEADISYFTAMNKINTLIESGYAHKSITTSYRCLNLNHLGSTDDLTPFMGNLNFRKALNLAIDRGQLCATVLTTDLPAFRLTAPSEMGVSAPFNEEYPYEAWPTAADAAAAGEHLNKALAELGKTIEEVPPLVLLCYESESSVTILSAVQDMLKRNLGLESVISSQTIGNMIAMAFGGEYDLWLGGNSVSVPDWIPGFALGYHRSSYEGQPLLRGYTKPEFDALYDAAVLHTDYKLRKDAQFALEQFMCEDVFNIVLSWTSTYYVFSPSLSNVYFRADGTPYYALIDWAQ